MFLHDVLNHTSAEKVRRTLEVTDGYKAVRFPPHHCPSCSKAKARAFGLSQQRPVQTLSEPVCFANADEVFDDDTDDDNGSNHGDL